MRPLVKLILMVGVVAISAVGGREAALHLRRARTTAEGTERTALYVDPESLRLGTVWETEQLTWELPVMNRGDEPITISSFRTTCNCVQIMPGAVTVPARGTSHLKLRLDLTDERGQRGDVKGKVRQWQATIAPEVQQATGQGNSRLGWVLEGRVRKVFELSSGYVDCGRRSNLEPGVMEGKLRFRTLIPVETVAAVVLNHRVTARVEQDPDRAGGYLLVVQVRPDGAIGEVDARINLVARQEGTVSLPIKSLQVSGWIIPDVQVSPQTLLLGPTAINRRVNRIIALQSVTNTPFEVVGVAIKGTGTEVERLPITGSHEMYYRVTQLVNAGGQHRSSVLFSTRSITDRMQRSVQLDIESHGVSESAMPLLENHK